MDLSMLTKRPERIRNALPVGGIDPAIFIDDDGQAYYYWGQLFSHGAKLLPDIILQEISKIIRNI